MRSQNGDRSKIKEELPVVSIARTAALLFRILSRVGTEAEDHLGALREGLRDVRCDGVRSEESPKGRPHLRLGHARVDLGQQPSRAEVLHGGQRLLAVRREALADRLEVVVSSPGELGAAEDALLHSWVEDYREEEVRAPAPHAPHAACATRPQHSKRSTTRR